MNLIDIYRDMMRFRPKILQHSGGSLFVSIPPEWARHHKLRTGDIVTPVLDEDFRLIIFPGEENEA